MYLQVKDMKKSYWRKNLWIFWNCRRQCSVHLSRNETDTAALIIEDQGIGISEEDLPLIFERFYRTDCSRNRKTGGAGIGLTIVKAIIQAHDGKIKVESKEGYGSKFTIMLPKTHTKAVFKNELLVIS